MGKTLWSTALIFLLVQSMSAQNDTLISPLQVSGYLESYYIYDFANPSDHNRPNFLYSFNRHNEVNLNLGFVQAAYDDNTVRGKLALMTGTYANANLSAEPGVLKNIFEANAGFKLSKNENIWLDAGIFASHIGFESAIGAICWNMTRSILAENSPYYLSGAKISYTSGSKKWFLSGLVLNGWQRIQRVPGNQTPALGHQLTWMPNSRITVNSSSLVGSDTPDSTRQMRYFHNLYAILQITKKIGVIAGFDIGCQQKAKGSDAYSAWFSPVLIMRFSATEKLAIGTRVEYYSDEEQVIVSTATKNGFQTMGYSVNLDVTLHNNVMWRLECRAFNSPHDKLFDDANENPVNENYFIGTSLSLAF